MEEVNNTSKIVPGEISNALVSDVVTAATRFVRANIELTLCQQYQFKQLCHRCWKYSACSVYAEYVDAWIGLEKLAGPSERDREILKNNYTR